MVQVSWYKSGIYLTRLQFLCHLWFPRTTTGERRARCQLWTQLGMTPEQSKTKQTILTIYSQKISIRQYSFIDNSHCVVYLIPRMLFFFLTEGLCYLISVSSLLFPGVHCSILFLLVTLTISFLGFVFE